MLKQGDAIDKVEHRSRVDMLNMHTSAHDIADHAVMARYTQ